MAVALIATGSAISSAGQLWATPGSGQAGRSVTAVSASGPHPSLYFRPVECTIAPAIAGNASTPAGAVVTLGASGQGLCSATLARQVSYPSTAPDTEKPGSIVVAPPYFPLPSFVPGAERYVLGPAEMSGSVIATATAAPDSQVGGWVVDVSFTKAGTAQFNLFAAKHYRCYAEDPTNPPYCALQAVVLDGHVLAAPALEARSFPGGVTIAGPASAPYTKAQAVKLAALARSSSNMAPLRV